MKIFYIANGTSIHIQRWVNYFVQKGHEIHLISWNFIDGYDKEVKTYRLIRFPPKTWELSKYPSGAVGLCQIKKLLNRIQPDILDAHYVTIHGYIGALIEFHPLVISAWGSDILIEPKKNFIHFLLTKYALKKADAVISLSPTMKKEIVKLGVEENKVRVILLGVDINKFSPAQRDSKLRQKLGISDSEPVVISTRNFSPIYNVETLIKAIPLVLEKMPQTKFVIIGDGPERNYLENLVKVLHIGNNVKFLGSVPHDTLSTYLASADVYVSTSLSDGTSNSLLEAMACSLAPVVTDIPANKYWVKYEENGFLFPMMDYETLAAKIIHLIRNEKLRKKFGEQSRKIVLEKAEHNEEMAKAERLYRELSRMRFKEKVVQ